MPIRLIENFRAIFYAPFYATVALGFFDSEGVEVEFVSSSDPGLGVSAVIAGTGDLTWGGPMRVMKAHDMQPRSSLICFCEVVARDPFFLVSADNHSNSRLSDLPALRFAAVSEVPTPWMCLQHDLREQGIDPTRIDRAADRSMAENFAALCDQKLDVVQVCEPLASMALQKGAGRILYAANTRGPTAYTAFISTRDGIQRNRSSFAGMVRAVHRVQNWLAEHGAGNLAEVIAPFFPEIPRETLVSSLQRYHQTGIWARNPAMSRRGFARLAESL